MDHKWLIQFYFVHNIYVRKNRHTRTPKKNGFHGFNGFLGWPLLVKDSRLGGSFFGALEPKLQFKTEARNSQSGVLLIMFCAFLAAVALK